MAGVEVGPDYHRSVPFEDMRVQADWISTLHSVVPWVHTPNIINGVPLTTEHAQAFFVTDLWHNFHLGVAKHFVGSGLVSVIESNLAAVQGWVRRSTFPVDHRFVHWIFQKQTCESVHC